MYAGTTLRVKDIAQDAGWRLPVENIHQAAFAEVCVDTLCAALGFRSDESGGHVRRTAIITELLLRAVAEEEPQYALSEAELAIISGATALHDVGKLRTPDAILLKPGRLTEAEMEIMRRHTTDGCDILNAMPGLKASPYYHYGLEICRWHHERWDGGGYPDGLRGAEIPLWAQAAGLADAFDALCSKRSYHQARQPGEALKMIFDGCCGSFNPLLLRCMARLYEESLQAS